MFHRILCCVFCLLASPALALDIYEDFILTTDNAPTPGETIRLHGSASLTIDVGSDGLGPRGVGHITLFDQSSLTLNAGQVRGSLIFRGDNEFTMNGGELRVDSGNGIRGYDTGRTVMNFNAGNIHFRGFQFTDAEGAGTQVVTVRDTVIGSAQVHATDRFNLAVVAALPIYSIGHDGNLANLAGTDLDLNGFLFVVRSPIQWSADSYIEYPEGDTNFDGTVDLSDLNNVRNLFGSGNGGESHLGDTLPFDGIIDLNDLNKVRNSFGDSQTVPEPATATLLGLFALAGIPLRCRYCSWLRRFP